MSNTPGNPRDSHLIEAEALIVAYAMSRLDSVFLTKFGFRSWRSAFTSTGATLDVAATSMKNLRDEFDPVHAHRKGWHKRPLRPNRQRVLSQFSDISDEALVEVVAGLLQRDEVTSSEVAAPLAYSKGRIEDVAQRLRTGRIAEEHFLRHSEAICGIDPTHLIDRRQEAAGYDFAVHARPDLAIEVKGLRTSSGGILFTDHEWRTAHHRRASFWLVVVGNIDTSPTARLWKDPHSAIPATSQITKSISVSWRAAVSVAS